MKASVEEGDLLDQDVDVIVNAWNRNVIPWWLLLPQGPLFPDGSFEFICIPDNKRESSHERS